MDLGEIWRKISTKKVPVMGRANSVPDLKTSSISVSNVDKNEEFTTFSREEEEYIPPRSNPIPIPKKKKAVFSVKYTTY